MKHLLRTVVTVICSLAAPVAASAATLSTDPSPIISNKAVKVTISGQDLGSDVYCYTWVADLNGSEKQIVTWDACINAKFKMTASGSTYTLTISNIQEFYGLSDSEMDGVKKLGFIARNTGGGQTDDLFAEVVQGRKTAYSGGEGTAASPFIIGKAQDLKDLAGYPADWESGVYFKQSASISGAGVTIGSIGAPFKANYNGDGYAITGVSVSQSALGQAAGLFGAIDGATISKLAVKDADVSGHAYVGVLVGYAKSGTISECYTSGDVNAANLIAGGLVGLNEGATITNCYSTAAVSARDQYAIGGLVGKNLGTIRNTYATGELTGHNYVGGLTGANYGTVANSVSANARINASNDYVARLGGNNNPENKATNNATWGGMPAQGSWTSHGDHADGLRDADLTVKSTYQTTLGWDFNSVWKWETKNGHSYPILAAMKDAQDDPFTTEFYNTASIENVSADNLAQGIIIVMSGDAASVMATDGSALGSVAIYNMTGALVAGANGISASEVTLDVAHLANGVYAVSVITADGRRANLKALKQ
ncbi:MAG: T9SS type A sorting domain-containing protein [Candidatus Amulumruptor caecigallinarius]|nr:T9SS type A sorting domain-containing protein [Candidatus Amulumruptor caecigallinarius]MCM1396006.1 T9SS type A sorting domain-containing protein [Candidatus Amulumruptor caecigallinarius]MCM1454558.1 T9SS type A sorting domain-containing protein [bacterium]